MTRQRNTFIFLVGLSFAAFVVVAEAQVITPLGSGVEAMFASQSEAYSDSDPTGIPWGLAAGIGPYPAGFIIPSLPTPPPAGLTIAPGNAFAGGGYTSVFNDNFSTNGYTAGQATVDDFVSGLPVTTSDVQIVFPAWRLEQGPTAVGYAYYQLGFGSNYLFTSNPGLAAAVNPAIPLLLTGQVIGVTGYAQFDAMINYDWTPVSVNTAGVIAPSGPMVSLGSLSYSATFMGPGPFFTTQFSAGSLAATPAGDGVLSLTGFAWVAGDPFELAIGVPEIDPSGMASVMALVTGGLGLLERRRRRAA